MIKKAKEVPCEIDICMVSDSYYINIDGTKRWLCKDHMQQLIDYLQSQFNVVSKEEDRYDKTTVFK